MPIPVLEERLAHHLVSSNSRRAINYKKPFVILFFREHGSIFPPTSTLPPLRLRIRSPFAPLTVAGPMSLRARYVPLLRRLSRSTRSPFHPSSSLSSRPALSFSSRRSLSALLACSCPSESDDWSSSTVRVSRCTLSRDFFISSFSCAFVLSRFSICPCKSRTVRSTLRTSRRSLLRVSSTPSSCLSS